MVRTRVQPSPGAELLREGAGRLRRAAVRMVPREVLVAWALSRIYSGALITAAARSGRPGPATGGFSKWDGWWYLMIGRFGYGRPPAGALPTRWPFFPLLPGVIGGIRHLGIPHRGGIVVVNHLVFLVALAGVWRIARRHSGGAAPRLAVWALAFFPLSFVFS